MTVNDHAGQSELPSHLPPPPIPRQDGTCHPSCSIECCDTMATATSRDSQVSVWLWAKQGTCQMETQQLEKETVLPSLTSKIFISISAVLYMVLLHTL